MAAPPAPAQPRPATIREASRDGGLIAAYTLVAPTDVAASKLLARAVVPRGLPCPRLRVKVSGGTRNLGMAPRLPGATAAPAFSQLQVCDRAIPQGATAASIAGTAIPAAIPGRVRRIAITGDTGCRIKGSTIQDCNNPEAWPLARISAAMAASDPDVILYLGDFLYREAACPTSASALCGGSPGPLPGYPFVDSDYAWLADALIPMAPMLTAAPIVVLRGNHETCERGGNGYFLFFDPRPDTADTCAPSAGPKGLTVPAEAMTASWAVTLPVAAGRSLRLAVVDSAYGRDDIVTSWAARQRVAYQAAQEATGPRKGRESWLLGHKPIFSYVTTDYAATNPPTWTVWSSLEQTAASVGLLGNYQLLLTSHNHLAQAVQIPGQPASLLLGNGGTMLDPPTGYPLPTYGPLGTPTGVPLQAGLTAYPAPDSGFTDVRFGFAVATAGKRAGQWQFQLRDPDGAATARCQLASRRIACG